MPTAQEFAMVLGKIVSLISRPPNQTPVETYDELQQREDNRNSGSYFRGGSAKSMKRGRKFNLLTQLSALYRMESDLTNSYGETKTLTPLGARTYGAGVSGNALLTSGGLGSTQFTDIIHHKKITVSMWARTNGNTAGVQLGSTGSYLAIGVNGSGFLNVNIGGNIISSADHSLELGVFAHILFTFNGKHLDIYLNGLKVIDNYEVINMDVFNEAFIIVAKISGLGTSAIDEVAFWSRILAPEEVTKIYNGGTGYNIIG